MSNIIYTFSSDRCCWIGKIPDGYKIDTSPGDDLIRIGSSRDRQMDCLTEFTDDYIKNNRRGGEIMNKPECQTLVKVGVPA